MQDGGSALTMPNAEIEQALPAHIRRMFRAWFERLALASRFDAIEPCVKYPKGIVVVALDIERTRWGIHDNSGSMLGWNGWSPAWIARTAENTVAFEAVAKLPRE